MTQEEIETFFSPGEYIIFFLTPLIIIFFSTLESLVKMHELPESNVTG
jgi:hypothetical protein